MQIESVLLTINRSEPAKNRFSVALPSSTTMFFSYLQLLKGVCQNYVRTSIYQCDLVTLLNNALILFQSNKIQTIQLFTKVFQVMQDLHR